MTLSITNRLEIDSQLNDPPREGPIPPRFRRIVVSTGVGLLPSFSALLTTLILWRAIAVSHSESEIGVFALCTQLAFYLTFLQAGLDTAAVLTMSGLLAQGQKQRAADQFHYLVRVNRRIGAGVVLTAAIAAVICRGASIPSPELASLAAGFACVLGSAQALAYLTRPYVAALSAEHRLIELSWVTVGQSLCRFALGYSAYLAGAGIYSLAIGELAAQFGAMVGLGILARRQCDWIGLEADAERPAGQLKKGAIISIGTIGWALESGSDVLLLQWLPNGLALVAVYTLWSRFPSLSQVVTIQLNHNTCPPLRSAWATDRVVAATLFGRLFLTQIGLSATVSVCVGIWLPSVVRFWLDGMYDLNDARSVSASLATFIAARSIMHLMYTACSAFESQYTGNLAIWSCLVTKALIGLFLGLEYGLSGFLVAGVIAWLPAYVLAAARLVRIGGGRSSLFTLGGMMLTSIWFVPWLIIPTIHVESLGHLVTAIAATGGIAGIGFIGWLFAARVIRPQQILRRG